LLKTPKNINFFGDNVYQNKSFVGKKSKIIKILHKYRALFCAKYSYGENEFKFFSNFLLTK